MEGGGWRVEGSGWIVGGGWWKVSEWWRVQCHYKLAELHNTVGPVLIVQ